MARLTHRPRRAFYVRSITETMKSSSKEASSARSSLIRGSAPT